jgi:hypothetical protein
MNPYTGSPRFFFAAAVGDGAAAGQPDVRRARNHPRYFVYMSTGNPNKGYEYTPIIEPQNVAPGQVSVHWYGPNELAVEYPRSAKVVEAYAKIFDVHVVLNPPL